MSFLFRGLKCGWLSVLCMVVLSCPGAAYAQDLAGQGALRGTVVDQAGAPVPSATVVLRNDAIGLVRNLQSSSDGGFQAASLPPASGYTLTVTANGFANYTAKEIAVHVGEIATIPISLSVSGTAETVLVEASSEALETTRSGVSELVSQREINDLPINGRRVDQFVLLTPGVTTDGSGGELTFRGVPGNNVFLQDGIDVTQQWGQDNAGSTSAFSPLSQDAVQEFQVQTSNYSAEFGHAAGGIVNTLTKSGTNSFHGSAFDFFKNRTLNSPDPFSFDANHNLFNPPNWRHQVGGSIGGPIKHDRLFFFGNTEETRESRPLVSSYSDSHLNTDGSFAPGACDTTIATAAQCAAAQTYIQRTYATVPRRLNENVGFAKLDWRPTDRDSFTANFNLMQFSSPGGTVSATALTDGSGYYPNGNQIDLTRWARFSYTRVVSPRALNEFRFGWFKDTRKQSLQSSLLPSDGLRSGLSVSSLSNLGVSVNIPNSQPSEDRFSFTDNYSLTLRNHQVKFGVESNYMRDVENALFFAKGEYFYGTVTDWALDLTPLPGEANAGRHWSGFLQSYGPLLTRAIVRDYVGYVQDQWQLKRELTLNLGLRYEFNRFTQPPENPAYPQTGQLNEPTKNFAPRLGFAYAMNKGETVLRGGFGISYARLPSASVIRLQQRNGTIQKTIFFGGGSPAGPTFPGYLLQAPGLSGGASNVTFADPHLATPYTEQADLTVEQKLDSKTTFDIAYLWNNGVKFLTRIDDNLKPPTSAFTYSILNQNGAQVGTYTTPVYTQNYYDPTIAVLNHIYNGGRLYYDAMVVSVNRRQSHYTQFSLSYTWAHSIDNGLGAGADNIYYTDPPITVYNGVQSFERGNSPLDQRQRLVATGLLTLPIHHYGSRFVDTIANGWATSIIETYATPQGVDPQVVITGQPFANANSTATLSGVGIGFAATQRVPFEPRSSLKLGTTVRSDARLTKTFLMPREQSITLNAEIFNAFNYTTVTSVNTTAYYANANGTLTPYDPTANNAPATPGKGYASAGFPDGTNARRGQVSVRYTF
jgi:Carboxypeptidase regulatory-like domain/TonB-dependent Receptor Plug Domain